MDAPENTLAAFRRAQEQGADGIELDVKLTADGQVVVMHDQTVERTTNGQGAVRRLGLKELRRLDAGSWFGPEFAGEKVPLLQEVFETCGQGLRYDVELTNYASPFDSLPEKVAEVIRRCGMEEAVIISSFLPTNLARFRRLCPGIAVGLIALGGTAGALSRSSLGRLWAPELSVPYFKDVTPGFMQAQKSCGRRVFPWPVNAAQDLRRMTSLGVDAIITDLPGAARAILEAAHLDV